MDNIKSLRNFGTIYLWIFAFKVLQVCGDAGYRPDTDTDRTAFIPALLMKPYAYQIFDDDFTDDLMNERNAIATAALWQALNRQQQQQQLFANNRFLPLISAKTKTKTKKRNSMPSREITFENLNDFDGYKVKNTIWPKVHKQQQHQQQQYHVKVINSNGGNEFKQPRHSLQPYFVSPNSLEDIEGSGGGGGGGGGGVGGKERTIALNIRFKQNSLLPIPVAMEKHFKAQAARVTKKSKTPTFNDANATNNNAGGVNEGDDVVKENLFPLKDDNTLNANDVDDDADADAAVAAVAAAGGSAAGVSYENVAVFADEENGIANSNGNGNESFNYADNNEANTNYIMTHTTHNDHNSDTHLNINGQTRRISTKPLDKRAKPSVGHTPFLPAVSGGAMTNLGKFFRDLSKNVHVNERYQWNAEEQKLLAGDPTFSDIHHHLSKPNAATDEQTAEWIKAIRFYRPSQKIRSLVAMNPHGQWAHNSQFIDPNYMWVGLGK